MIECSEFLREALHVVNILVPACLGNLLEYLPVVTGLAFVGHEPGDKEKITREQDAASLARTYFNLVAFAPAFGLISALRTQCPQAVGAGQPRQCAAYCQRAFIVIVAYSMVVIPMLMFSDRVLVWTGQDPALAKLAQPYAVCLLVSYFGVATMSIIQRIFQAHEMNYGNLVIVAIGCLTAPPLQWFMIPRMGYLGAAWAGGIYNCLFVVLQIPYLCWFGHSYAFKPQWSAFTLSGFVDDARLFVPGLIMTVAEWGSLEMIVLFSGHLHNSEAAIGASALGGQVEALGAMMWIGLNVAASTLVGHRIGAGDVPGAKRAAKATGVVGVLLGVAAGCITALLAPQIAHVYTKSSGICSLATKLLPLLGIMMVWDASSVMLGGLCSGLGMMRIPAVAQLVGYYAAGLPFGAVCVFFIFKEREVGIYFLWGGVLLAMFIAATIQLVALILRDWDESAREAKARIARERGRGSESEAQAQEAEMGREFLAAQS